MESLLQSAPATRTFEELECWKAARDLRVWIKGSVIPQLPPDEKFRLSDQLIRASRSISANIAEGHGRYHFRDNIKFCREARGSLNEVLDHLIIAADEQYISAATMETGREHFNRALRILNGYIAWMSKNIATAAP